MESLPKLSQESSLLQLMIQEQRKTNELLLMLIEAMGQEDDVDDEEAQPHTYLDGSTVI